MARFFSCNGFFPLADSGRSRVAGNAFNTLHFSLVYAFTLPHCYRHLSIRMSKSRRPPPIANPKNPLAPALAEPPLSLFETEEMAPVSDVPTEEAPAPAPAQVESPATDEVEDDEPLDLQVQARKTRDRLRREEESLAETQPVVSNPKLERIGRIAALILVPLVFVGIFYTLLNKRPIVDVQAVNARPTLPITGQLLQIPEVTTGWRERTEGDRVSPEARLLSRAQIYPTKLPELHLKVSTKAASAFLRILFINSEGKIAGDAKVVKIQDGKIQAPGGTGDHLLNDQECAIAATTGLQTDYHLSDYLRSTQPRWKVEISESSNYQAKGDEWRLLDTFAIADVRL